MSDTWKCSEFFPWHFTFHPGHSYPSEPRCLPSPKDFHQGFLTICQETCVWYRSRLQSCFHKQLIRHIWNKLYESEIVIRVFPKVSQGFALLEIFYLNLSLLPRNHCSIFLVFNGCFIMINFEEELYKYTHTNIHSHLFILHLSSCLTHTKGFDLYFLFFRTVNFSLSTSHSHKLINKWFLPSLK